MTSSAAQPIVDALAAELSKVRSAIQLREVIAAAIARHADGRAIVWCEAAEIGAQYVCAFRPGRGGDGQAGTFAANTRLVRWLRVNDELLLFNARPAVWDYLSAEDQAALLAMRAYACLPLVADGELVAFVALCGDGTAQDRMDVPGLLEALARRGATQLRQAKHRERAVTRTEGLRRSQQLGVAGQVAASVAHEVRNPLAAIRSLVQFVRDVALPAEERESMLDDVLEEVDRIDRTVTGMLQLSQPSSVVRSVVAVDELTRSSTRFVRAYARRRGVTFDTDAPRTLLVFADERELRQVLTNLLLNACQACEGGGVVTAFVRPADPDARYAEVEVKDSGRGISPEHLERIFEPFFTTKPQGTGLGLAFCRDVVERHGGTIAVHSTVGVGTSVRVRLPVWETDASDSGR